MSVLKYICSLDHNPELAATLAIVIMALIIIGCSIWLICKHLHLKKKYSADEEYVKEYRKKLKEQEQNQNVESSKPTKIGEDF